MCHWVCTASESLLIFMILFCFANIRNRSKVFWIPYIFEAYLLDTYYKSTQIDVKFDRSVKK